MLQNVGQNNVELWSLESGGGWIHPVSGCCMLHAMAQSHRQGSPKHQVEGKCHLSSC
jgi:hypothetical protein